eukprot:433208-Pyramimonas_sp.AAC.1
MPWYSPAGRYHAMHPSPRRPLPHRPMGSVSLPTDCAAVTTHGTRAATCCSPELTPAAQRI